MAPFADDDHPWGSHLPALLTCVMATEGQVLEVGVGHYSTPVLHAVCGMGRLLWSLEDDRDWFLMFSDFGSPRHGLRYFQDYWPLQEMAASKWGVVFLDHSPGERRGSDAALFKDTADFVVIHDYSFEDVRGPIDKIAHLFKHQFVHTRYMPSTIILSQREIPAIP